MAKITNWSLIAKEKADYIFSETLLKKNRYERGVETEFYEKLVPWGTIGAYVIGVSIGGRGEFEGEMIHTSKIAEFGDGFVKTQSGSIYELGEKSADYVRYEEALAKDMPVITNWSLGTVNSHRSDDIYFLQGSMTTKERNHAFMKEVKYQNLEERTIEFADGTVAFMDYYAVNPKQMRNFKDSVFITGGECIYEENEFCNYKVIFIFAKMFLAFCGTAALPVFEEDLLKYRKDHHTRTNFDDFYRYFIISADDMAMDMTAKERMAVAKEVEA